MIRSSSTPTEIRNYLVANPIFRAGGGSYGLIHCSEKRSIVGKKPGVSMGGIHDTETLFSQSRNKFAGPGRREGGRKGPSLLLQFLPRRVVRFRRCNGSLVSFPRRGGDLSRGGWRTITLHLQFHAALASSLPSISFPPIIPCFVVLLLSLSLSLSSLLTLLRFRKRATEFEKFWREPRREREKRRRRRQTVAKLLRGRR